MKNKNLIKIFSISSKKNNFLRFMIFVFFVCTAFKLKARIKKNRKIEANCGKNIELVLLYLRLRDLLI